MIARSLSAAASTPAKMIAVDTHEGRLYHHEEIIDELAGAHPYEQWLGNIVDLDAALERPRAAPLCRNAR